MRVQDLIAALRKMPPKMDVAILNLSQNIDADSLGEGTSTGIFSKFEVRITQADELPDGAKPWVAIQYDDPYYEKREE